MNTKLHRLTKKVVNRKKEHQVIIIDKIKDTFKYLIYLAVNKKINKKLYHKNVLNDIYVNAYDVNLDALDTIGFEFTTNKNIPLKTCIDSESRAYDFDMSIQAHYKHIEYIHRYNRSLCPLGTNKGMTYQAILLKLFYTLVDIRQTYGDNVDTIVKIKIKYLDEGKQTFIDGYCNYWLTKIRCILSGDNLNSVTYNVKVNELYKLLCCLFDRSGLNYLRLEDSRGYYSSRNYFTEFTPLELNLITWLNKKLDEPMVLLGGLDIGLKLAIKKYKKIKNVNGYENKLDKELTLYHSNQYLNEHEALNYAYNAGSYYSWFMQVAMLMRYNIAEPSYLDNIVEYIYKLNYITSSKQANNKEIVILNNEITDVFYNLIGIAYNNGVPANCDMSEIFNKIEYIENYDSLYSRLLSFYKTYYLRLVLNQ